MFGTRNPFPPLLVILLIAIAAPACRVRSPDETRPGSVPPAPAETSPFVVTDRAPRSGGPVKVLLSFDMEGLSGISDPLLYRFRSPRFAEGQRLLAAEVKAVVEGLVAGGAASVDIFDQHGSGQPDSVSDLPRDLVPPQAQLVYMSESITADQAREHGYDAVVTIGGHGRANSGAFASHTISYGLEVITNGVPLTEASLIGMQWGQFGVPYIMAGGDDRLLPDLGMFPGLEFVTVKRSIDPLHAELIPLDTVYAQLRSAAQRAIGNVSKAKAVTLRGPVRVVVRALPPDDLGPLRGFPGVSYQGDSLIFSAPRLTPDALDGMFAVLGLSSALGRLATLTEAVNRQPNGNQILEQAARIRVDRFNEHQLAQKPLPPKRP